MSFAAKALLSLGLLSFCIFKPFWIGISTFNAIFEAGNSFHDNTITYILFQGMLIFNQAYSPELAMALLRTLFLCVYMIIFAYTFRKGLTVQNILRTISVIFFVYFSFASFQFGSWYLAWLIPFLMISDIPLAFFLQALLGFAALISFWKRISYLLCAVGVIYFIILFWYYKSTDKKNKLLQMLSM